MKVSKSDMLTIAKIKDKADRSGVVNLIASGMEPEDALVAVMKDKAPIRDACKSKAEKEAKDAAKKEFVSDLTDDEWFDRYCGDKAKMFANPAQYRADALLFRKISELRHAFRSRVKVPLKDAKDRGVVGPMYYAVNKVISMSHPTDWMICDDCVGKGVHKDRGGRCGKCAGSGFLLKMEIYV
jgi:hypothetical protein